MPSKNPIFVMGHPRSGTSITAWVLGQHPKIQYHFEETNIFDLELERLIKSPFRWVAMDEYKKKFTNLDFREGTALNYFETECLLDPNIYPSLRQFIDTCLLYEEGKTSFVEKTPLHIFYVDTIRKVYPDSIILIPQRDKEQVVASMLDKAWSPHDITARRLFYDIIQNEIERVVNSHYNILKFDLDHFCRNPNQVIEFLIKRGFDENGFEAVRAAHKDRVNVKYLTQDKKKDSNLDQIKRMAANESIDTFGR